MPIRLSFETGALAGAHIVTAAQTVRIGRDPQANDLLLTNPKVSRRHAILERSVRGGYSIEIIGAGPSKLNGEPIVAIAGRPTVQVLASGDVVDLGEVVFRVEEADVKLICVAGKSAGRELVVNGAVSVGSGGDCDLVLDDPDAAQLHLEIESTPLGLKVHARARTLFNGAPADTRVLANGDEIVLGGSTLRCRVAVATDHAAKTIIASRSIVGVAAVNAVGELVAIAGAAKGERLPLGDAQLILGTRADCSLILNDALASPVHCAISKEGDRFVATDLGSETGTFVNGTRISAGTPLQPGDLVAVGAHVFEARMLGGVAQATKAKTIFTTMGIDLGGPKPRFVIDGRVVSAKRIVLGRAPSCDVICDEPTVSREHCAIEWQGAAFAIHDTSTHGTYLDDRRVAKHEVPPTGVLRVGNTLFRLTARGEVCTIERTDAALAEAALEVARAQASRTRLAAPAPSTAGGAGSGIPMKTVFRLDVAQLEHEIAARKKDKQRGAPAWRPSSDLAGQVGLRGAVVLSVIAALALGALAIGFRHGRALEDHPLSVAHSSAAFAAKRTGVTPCASCHSAGARVDTAKCEACHTSFAARAAHHALDCGRCHREHEGLAAGTALGAQGTCASCHPHQHAAEFAGADAPQQVPAGPLPASVAGFASWAPTGAKIIALHAAHAVVAAGGKQVAIPCTSCHAARRGGALAAAKPGLACLRCHATAGPKDHACDTCHGHEHAATPATFAIAPAMSAASPGRGPTPVTSLAFALGLALVGGGPSLAYGTWVRLRRRRRTKAMVEELKAHPAEVVKRLVHSINDSKCVGCGLCVQACPASVLELVEHKSRVVNFDACIQCKRCENACAFDALRMHDADKPPPMIPMPSLDAFHETPVAGMFLIGQASGTPQVKNATNLGRAVIQRMLQRDLAPGAGRARGCDVDVAIVGSGPAGLSAALTCIEAGLSYVVLEKERELAWTIRNYYHKGKEVMAEPNDVALEATLPHWDSSREELLGTWQQMIDQHRVDIRYQADVADVKKDGERFVVTLAGKGGPAGQITAARVVLAIGTLGNPRKLGCPGDDLPKVKNSLVDPDEWQGKSILVVGGSDSAVEVVLALCKPHLRNKVYFSTRGAKLEGIKPKNRKLIEDAQAAGQFELRAATSVAEVTPTSVALSRKEDGQREDLPNDVVFAMIGGTPPQKWLQQIGVPYVDKPHSWSPPRTDFLAQKTAEGLVQLRRLPVPPLPQRKPHH